MINCHDLQFSSRNSQKRTERAKSIIGTRALTLIIGLVLYILGAKRSAISMTFDVPGDTLKSFFQRFFKNGLSALTDQRRKSLPTPSSTFKTHRPDNADVKIVNDEVVIRFGSDSQYLKIPIQNKLQIKTVLLTCLDNKLLKNSQIFKILGYSARHTLKLSGDLIKGDVYSLLDKRQGQKQDYLVTPEVKAELIQQFVVALLTKEAPTGKQISDALKERCEINMSDRTVRYHISKLGLHRIKESLPKLFSELKKSSRR